MDATRYRRASCFPGIHRSFRVLSPNRYRSYLVERSRSAVGPCPGLAVFPGLGHRPITVVRAGPILSASSISLQSVARLHLVPRPKPENSSRGLLFPSAHSGIEGPRFADDPCLLRSALRVWSPSRRFPPFGPAPAFFHADSAHGIHPSKPFPPVTVHGGFPPRSPAFRWTNRCAKRLSPRDRTDPPPDSGVVRRGVPNDQ